MACREAPVAQRLYHDSRVRYGTRVGFLGIIGDQSHQARTSSHNCAPRQEGPVNGKQYDPGYAHALDLKVFGDRALGLAIVNILCRDPRVRYCIFQAVLYYGIHYRPGPNGTILTAPSSGHPDHVHTSLLPGTTFDTRPFYTTAPTEEDLSIMDPTTKRYLDTEFGNITERDAAMQDKFAEEVEAVDQKSRRVAVSVAWSAAKAAGATKAQFRDELTTDARKVFDKIYP